MLSWNWSIPANVSSQLTAALVVGLATAISVADEIPGTAIISGTVTAEDPFTAAQVYALNHDKRMLYMVYTNRGRYKTINLMPQALR